MGSMTYFDVYQGADNPAHVEVVKQGFSWPGFFFTWIWALVKQMPRYGIILLGVDTVLFVAGYFAPEESLAAGLLGLIHFPVGIVVGAYGNQWRRTELEQRGFTQATTLGAKDSEQALYDWQSRLAAEKNREALRDELTKLSALVDDGLMTEAEYKARRKTTLRVQQFGAGVPGHESAVAAFILIPIGVALTLVGWLGEVWALAFVGALALALGVAFAGITYWLRRDIEKFLAADSDPEEQVNGERL